MTLVLKDIILRASVDLLSDVTELQTSDDDLDKQMKKNLDTLSHSLANIITKLDTKES